MNHITLHWLLGLSASLAAATLGGGCGTSPTSTPAMAGSTPSTLPAPAIERPAAVEQYVKGYQAYQQGQPERAVRELESAVRKNPNLIMARSVLGEIYRSREQYQNAARHYEVLSNRDEYTLANHYYLGVSYQFLTRFKESAGAYMRGLKLEPDDFNTNLNLGSVYLSLGDIDRAVSYMDRATQINPQSHAAWSNLGVVLDARNSVVLAETAYRKALELQPESLAVQQNLATNLLLQKKTPEAIELWEAIVQRSKTNFTQTKLAEAYTQGTELSRAAELLDEVLGRDPRYVPALNAKAMVLLRQYELSQMMEDSFRAQAIELVNRSLALNSSQPKLQELLRKYGKPIAIPR